MRLLLTLSLVLEVLLVAYFFVPKSAYFPEGRRHPATVQYAPPYNHRQELAHQIKKVTVDCMMFVLLACNSFAMVVFWRRLQYEQVEKYYANRKPESFQSWKKSKEADIPEDPD